MSELQVEPIAAFSDNYIWALKVSDKDGDTPNKSCAIVDPGDGKVVLDYLNSFSLSLTDILVTHHHPDHVGGVKLLKKNFPDCIVYANPESRFQDFDQAVQHGDEIRVLECTFKVFGVPGHTLDHLAYFGPAQPKIKTPILFCGDTLFSAGCGRLFEGSAEQMHQSLANLSKLPENTLVYCAHEYTLSNLEFARTIEPENQALIEYTEQCTNDRKLGIPTIPTTIGKELAINPFLRTNSPSVASFLDGQALDAGISSNSIDSEVGVFAAIRRAKDCF